MESKSQVVVVNQTNLWLDNKSVKKLAQDYLASQRCHSIMNAGVVFVEPGLAKQLNKKYRGKNYIPEVLTFPNPVNEILICPTQAKANGFTIEQLVNHGLDHLMGKEHG